MKGLAFYLIMVIFVIFLLGLLGGTLAYKHLGPNIAHLATTSALDSGCTDQNGIHRSCYLNEPQPFDDFWREVIRNTVFTKNGKPVEITDIQVFYKEDNDIFYDIYNNICTDARIPQSLCRECRTFPIPHGNITYYPNEIENSQIYKKPPQSCWGAAKTASMDNLTLIFEHEVPCLTPAPTPCAWEFGINDCDFCGKVSVNTKTEFESLLDDIEKHSYHIQMGYMHLNREYLRETYNTFPATVNINIGIAPGDSFPVGSEWESRIAYTRNCCPPYGSCDFDLLEIVPTLTPTSVPTLVFPDICSDGCLICNKGLGNCTYIQGAR